jgi:hypothetical protein
VPAVATHVAPGVKLIALAQSSLAGGANTKEGKTPINNIQKRREDRKCDLESTFLGKAHSLGENVENIERVGFYELLIVFTKHAVGQQPSMNEIAIL